MTKQKELNKWRRIAGLATDYQAEAAEDRKLREQQEHSVSSMNSMQSKGDAMYYLVHDPSPVSEPVDVISHIDGESFANIFIGAGGTTAAARENWALYNEREKDKALADINARLEKAGKDFRITESLEIEQIEEDEQEQPEVDPKIENAIRSVIQHIKNNAQQYKDDPDLSNITAKDYHDYTRILQSLKMGSESAAKSVYHNMDTAARELLAKSDVVPKKSERKVAAKFFGYALNEEENDLVEESEGRYHIYDKRSQRIVTGGFNTAKDAYYARAEFEKEDKKHLVVRDNQKRYVDRQGDPHSVSESAEENIVHESNNVYDKKVFTSHEDSDVEPSNVVKQEKKKGIKGKEDTPPALWKDSTEEDKDESPTQLRALDEPSDQDNSGGGDLDRSVKVPNKVKQALKDEIDEARKEAKRLDVYNRQASEFYEDLANAFEDLQNHLEGGTVYDIKQAQMYMQSLMGPMYHKIPAEVVKFLAHGGEPRSLKSYMTDISKNYPIIGPRNNLK